MPFEIQRHAELISLCAPKCFRSFIGNITDALVLVIVLYNTQWTILHVDTYFWSLHVARQRV